MRSWLAGIACLLLIQRPGRAVCVAVVEGAKDLPSGLLEQRALAGEPIGNPPPAEFEELYYERSGGPTIGVGLT